MRFLILLILTSCSCSKPVDRKPPLKFQNAELVAARNFDLLEQAEDERDFNGWLVADCDGMLWTAKYASARGVGGVDILAAEIEPGRFGRSHENDCDEHWSRDMGLMFIIWAHRTGNLPALERHAAYGREHNWKMGTGDGRTIYTPQMVGHLYQAIFDLGGEDNANRMWPVIYPGGLDDYHAHLQMLGINFRFEADKVTEIMVKRIKEHAEREPSCGFYQVMLGTYTGDFSQAIRILSQDDKNKCEYVRCDGMKGCQLAEDIWATDLLLRRLE